MFLSQNDFITIIQKTPLVSIDLIIENSIGNILLGLRKNRPANNSWFVPGGRILKGETFHDAFMRISKMELGECYTIKESKFYGVWQHFYDDNYYGDSFRTHYIVLAFHLEIKESSLSLPSIQHEKYQWIPPREILDMDGVHPNTRAYFQNTHSDGTIGL